MLRSSTRTEDKTSISPFATHRLLANIGDKANQKKAKRTTPEVYRLGLATDGCPKKYGPTICEFYDVFVSEHVVVDFDTLVYSWITPIG